MSFDKLLSSSVSKKTKTVTLESGGEKLVFTAHELTMTQRIRLTQINTEGGDTFLHWIVFSIVDQEGKHMTVDQAALLPDDVMEKFLDAVLSVNPSAKKTVEKKRKTKPKKK